MRNFSFFLLLSLFFGLQICKAQNLQETANQQLCAWVSATQKPKLDSAKMMIDNFVAAGASINCSCQITKEYTNYLRVLGNGIKNALASFFLNRKQGKHDGETYTKQEFYTPVHLWVLAENKPLIEYAVNKHKADLNIPNSEKIYPLETVVKNRQLDYAKWLVSLGASPKNIEFCAYTIPMAEWLISEGCKIETANWGCMNENEELINHLLGKYKPNLATTKYANTKYWENCSPKTLDLVFQCGVKSTADLIDHHFNFHSSQLLAYALVFDKYGADFSECGFFGCPLSSAIKENSLAAVKLMADKGVLNVKAPICTDNLAILDYLVAKGFATDNIDVSCLLNKPEVLEIAIQKYKPNLNLLFQKNNFDDISLRSLDILAAAGFKPSNAMLLALLDNEVKLKLMLQKYKPDISFLSGNKDLDKASTQSLDLLFGLGVEPPNDLLSYRFNFSLQDIDNYKLAQVFVKHKKNLNSCDFFGCALEILIKNDDLQTLKLLVENGADITQKFDNGQTALEYAKSMKRMSMVNYLQTKTGK